MNIQQNLVTLTSRELLMIWNSQSQYPVLTLYKFNYQYEILAFIIFFQMIISFIDVDVEVLARGTVGFTGNFFFLPFLTMCCVVAAFSGPSHRA